MTYQREYGKSLDTAIWAFLGVAWRRRLIDAELHFQLNKLRGVFANMEVMNLEEICNLKRGEEDGNTNTNAETGDTNTTEA